MWGEFGSEFPARVPLCSYQLCWRGAPRELSAVRPRSVCVVFAAAQLRCARGARAPVSCTLLARGRWLVCVRARALSVLLPMCERDFVRKSSLP